MEFNAGQSWKETLIEAAILERFQIKAFSCVKTQTRRETFVLLPRAAWTKGHHSLLAAHSWHIIWAEPFSRVVFDNHYIHMLQCVGPIRDLKEVFSLHCLWCMKCRAFLILISTYISLFFLQSAVLGFGDQLKSSPKSSWESVVNMESVSHGRVISGHMRRTLSFLALHMKVALNKEKSKVFWGMALKTILDKPENF